MVNSQPILSLCLPTNGAIHWVIPTLEGVYSQGVDNTLFEFVITDNGENSKLKAAIEQFDYCARTYTLFIEPIIALGTSLKDNDGFDFERACQCFKSLKDAYIEDIGIQKASEDPIVRRMNKEEIEASITFNQTKMQEAAKNLDFVLAAQYRDEMIKLEDYLKSLSQ